jgi:hypothetical protein
VHIPLGTANISAYFQDTSLPGCVNTNQHNNSAVKSSNLAIATFFIQCNKAIEGVCNCIPTMKQYLGIHFIKVFLCI